MQADGQLQLHPLAQEIQVLTELGGEERGIGGGGDTARFAPIDPDVRAGLLAVPAQVVVLARVHVRIVVTEAPRLQVSVVADSEPSHVAEIESVDIAGVELRVEYDDGQIWVESTATPSPADTAPLSDALL
ncbi:hypothetical protein ACETU7_08145 [Rhodococcus sp. 3Y1]